MPTIKESFAETFNLLLDITTLKTEEALKKIKTGGRTYIKVLIILALSWIIGVPLLIILKAYTGIAVFSYAAAAVSVILIIAIFALWLPLGILIGMLKGETINPAVAGANYVRKSALAVFVGLLISLYAIKMPIENNPDAVPMLFVAVAALIVGIYLWGSWIPGKIYVLGLLVLIWFTTMSFFTPHPIDFALDKLGCNQPAYSTPTSPGIPPSPVKRPPTEKKTPPRLPSTTLGTSHSGQASQQSSRQASAGAQHQTAPQPPVQPTNPRETVLISLKPNQWSREEFLQSGSQGVEFLGECHWLDFKFKEDGRTIVVRYHAATQKYFLAAESGQTQGLYNGTLGNRPVSFRSDGNGVVKLTYRNN